MLNIMLLLGLYFLCVYTARFYKSVVLSAVVGSKAR